MVDIVHVINLSGLQLPIYLVIEDGLLCMRVDRSCAYLSSKQIKDLRYWLKEVLKETEKKKMHEKNRRFLDKFKKENPGKHPCCRCRYRRGHSRTHPCTSCFTDIEYPFFIISNDEIIRMHREKIRRMHREKSDA